MKQEELMKKRNGLERILGICVAATLFSACSDKGSENAGEQSNLNAESELDRAARELEAQASFSTQFVGMEFCNALIINRRFSGALDLLNLF